MKDASDDFRCIRQFIVHAVAAFLGLFAVTANAQTGLVTWTLKDVSHFTSNETASGSFTLDPAPAIGAPPGSAGQAVGWTTVVAAERFPIPSITLSSSDSGCLVFGARIETIEATTAGRV